MDKRKKESTETTAVLEITVVTETTAEVTILSELQKEWDERQIEEAWTEETEITARKETEPPKKMTEHEKYLTMLSEAQQEFFESFGSVDAYFIWLNNAKAEYEKQQNATIIEGGTVDMGLVSRLGMNTSKRSFQADMCVFMPLIGECPGNGNTVCSPPGYQHAPHASTGT